MGPVADGRELALSGLVLGAFLVGLVALARFGPPSAVQEIGGGKATELTVRPLLPGLRQLTGERIQRYLASELRDRIRASGVRIEVVDRTARKSLPGYAFQRAPGETWRSRYDAVHNVIVVSNGHRDSVYTSRERRRKLRHLCCLFSKELVLHNFPRLPAEQLLERMVELALHTEENLRSVECSGSPGATRSNKIRTCADMATGSDLEVLTPDRPC